jgi:hypothetical protein
MKRIHFLLLGLLVSLTIAAVSPSLPPTRIAPGANTTIVTNGVNSFTISSAAGGTGAQLAGTNLFSGTNTFSQPVFVTNQLVQAGVAWKLASLPDANALDAVCYGNGIFVAVGSAGTGNRVKTSPDGVNWTSRTSAADNSWRAVCYGNGLFVATASSGTGNRVMTSPDGITWTSRAAAVDNNWYGLTYGNGIFVATSINGTGNRVMSSPDGITWTSRTSAADNAWYGVTYGNGIFVAVSYDGADRVMSSPDGITWTSRSAAAVEGWVGVTYGNGRFVAVADTIGSMYSSDGVTWTSGADVIGYYVTYGGGVFVTQSSVSSVAAYSLDGANWNFTVSGASSALGVAYGNGLFVSVTSGGSASYSGLAKTLPTPANNILQGGWRVNGGLNLGTDALMVNSTQVVTNRQAAVADAAGGVVIDAEARTALNALLARLRTHGLITP